MKTCPKCNASMPDDVNFCTECGTKMSEPQEQTKFCISCGAKIPYEAQFCPECAAKQVVEEKKKIDLYESITKPEISFQAGYGHNYVAAGAGGLTISLLGISYESNLKSVSAVLSLIGTLGKKTRISISFKDITAIGHPTAMASAMRPRIRPRKKRLFMKIYCVPQMEATGSTTTTHVCVYSAMV